MIVSINTHILRIFIDENRIDENGLYLGGSMIELQAINITKKMIPEIFKIELIKGWIDNTGKNSGDIYLLRLNNDINIEFRDKAIVLEYFKILLDDFENKNIDDDYPELFL